MNISVFCGASTPRNQNYIDAAQCLGELLARRGHTLLYGGSNLGLMGAVSRAAYNNGGTVVGVIPTFFSEEIIRSQPVSQLVRVTSMSQRKDYLLSHSDAFIALPGGIGTLDEILETMVANQLNLHHKPVGLLNTNNFYRPFMTELRHLEQEGFYNLATARYLFLEEQPSRLLQQISDYRPSATAQYQGA